MNNFSSIESSSFNLKNDYDPKKQDTLTPLQMALKKKREQITDTKVGEMNPISGDRQDKDPVD